MSVYEPYVPSTIIKKYIVMWLAEDEGRTLQDAGRAVSKDVRSLYRIMHGECETVRFDTADTILMGLGYYLAWYQDPELSEFYAAA